ncbi:MAG: Blp family class II bacteriocin [Aquabacterium sp.]|nr:Blp family class II bacteriocin [Aquabacterium sp.]
MEELTLDEMDAVAGGATLLESMGAGAAAGAIYGTISAGFVGTAIGVVGGAAGGAIGWLACDLF